MGGWWKREDDGEDEKGKVRWEDGGRGEMMVRMRRGGWDGRMVEEGG